MSYAFDACTRPVSCCVTPSIQVRVPTHTHTHTHCFLQAQSDLNLSNPIRSDPIGGFRPLPGPLICNLYFPAKQSINVMFVLLIVHTILHTAHRTPNTELCTPQCTPYGSRNPFQGAELLQNSKSQAFLLAGLRFAYTRSIAGDLFSCRNRRLIVTHYEIYFVQQMQKV